MMALIAVLKLKLLSKSSVTFLITRCNSRRNATSSFVRSPVWFSLAAWSYASTIRHTRPKKRKEPSTPWSLQSRSRSTGAANKMNKRAVSAPYLLMISSGETTLPLDLDILLPSLSTIPCVKRPRNGSLASMRPKSWITFTKKREYNKCKIACSIPPMYWSTFIQ